MHASKTRMLFSANVSTFTVINAEIIIKHFAVRLEIQEAGWLEKESNHLNTEL